MGIVACQPSSSEIDRANTQIAEQENSASYQTVTLTPEQSAKIETLRAAAKAVDAASKPQENAASWQVLKDYMLTIYSSDHPEIMIVDRWLAETLFYTGDIKGAAAAFEKQIVIMEQAGPEYESELIGFYNNIGVAYNYLSRHKEAREIAQKVLEYRKREFGDIPDAELAQAYNNVAASDMELALYDSAISNITLAIDMADRLETPPPTAAIWYANLSVYLRKAGRDDEAIRAARKAALKIETLLPENHPFGANNLSSLGVLLTEQGKLREAERVMRKALDIATAAHGPKSEQAAAFQIMMAQILLAKGDTETARNFAQTAQQTFIDTTGKDSSKEILARQRIAKSYFQERDYDKAIELQFEIVEDWKASIVDQNREFIVSRDLLSEYLLNAKQYSKAKDVILTNRAAKTGLYSEKSIEVLISDSQLLLAQSHLTPNDVKGSDIKSVYEMVTAKDISQYLTSASLSTNSVYMDGIYASLFASFFEVSDEALSFQIARRMLSSEAGQAVLKTQLRDALTSEKSRNDLRIIQDLTEDKLTLEREYSGLVTSGNVEKLKSHQVKMTALEQKLEAQTQDLVKRDSVLSNLLSAKDSPLALYSKNMSQDEAYLGYLESLGELYAVLLTKHGFSSQRLSILPSDIRQHSNNVRASLTADVRGSLKPFDKKSASELFKSLFPAKIKEALKGVKDLHIVPSRISSELPFAALVISDTGSETKWLSDNYALSVATAFGELSKQKQQSVSKAVRMVGVSGDFDITEASGSNFMAYRSFAGAEGLKNLPPLPETKAEIAAISNALNTKGSSLLSGADSTEKNFRALDLAKIDLLAFATHGLMSGELEGLDEPALVLNVADDTDNALNDGLLTASEISKLKLNSDWVILSACNTASSNGNNSSSYAGLTRAFLYAGADSLLVSHWPVRDDAAAFLTVNTVKNTQGGMSKSKALQTAMRDLRKNPDIPNADHPAIWAPFVLVGK